MVLLLESYKILVDIVLGEYLIKPSIIEKVHLVTWLKIVMHKIQ